jgi:hypothetical protein
MFKRRLKGIGMLRIVDCKDAQTRDVASIEVTKDFAREWDADMLNHAYLSREAMEALNAVKPKDCNSFGAQLIFRGRFFASIF